ncbi:MAG: DUF2269 family protein [Bacteroidota bacterium]|jgi:uncharacterized membrane protein
MEYSFYKLIHILGVALFLGNIITGLFWMHRAIGTKNISVISHTMKGIIDADTYFTIPCVIVIVAAGFMTAIIGQYPMLTTGWILWPIILFSISGATFTAKVGPLQKKIHALAADAETKGTLDWDQFHSMVRAWNLWGAVAVVTPLTAAVMMVLKVPQ